MIFKNSNNFLKLMELYLGINSKLSRKKQYENIYVFNLAEIVTMFITISYKIELKKSI